MDTHTSLAADVSIRDRWLITALLGLGLITFAIDASNTRLVLPQMMTSLRVELYQSHWVFTAPGIARTVLTASTGWLSGWVGPRPLYLLSIGSLTLGALGSLLAWDWPSLLVFRVLAGMGGGMIPPLSQAIFYQIFPPGQRGMALGFALMGWSIGPAFGPLMGGTLLETAPWRIVYAVTLPLSGVGLLLAWWWLPPLHRPPPRRLDVLGVALLAVAVSTLLVALTQGNRDGWDAPHILTLLALAGVTAVAFVVVQWRRAEPLVELRLFGSVPFVMAMIVMFLTTMAFRGSEPMLSVFMQRLLGWEPPLVERLVGQVLLQGQLRTAWFLRRHEDLHLGKRERQEAQILQQPTPRREGVGGGLSDAPIMDTAAVGVAQKEDDEERVDEQDIFDGVVFFLAVITRFLSSSILGADDPPFRPVMGKRGEAGAVADVVATGVASSACGVTTVAASASETPRRCARALRERAGASPRARNAASSAGSRT